MRFKKQKQTLITSFFSAINGIKYAIFSQRNLKIQVLLSFILYLLAFLFNIDQLEWIILVLSTLFLISAEIFNSSIECLVDLVTNKNKIRAKLTKDMAAGAVLVSSIQMVIITILLFYSRFVTLLSEGVYTFWK
ncbi:hypothetical protein DID75_03935 [Candidatus Marinamargulisbacteria bacterium SCGC AG-410-N11]|nr:hypothetical protein DID75_03935 [Candidatus Marinamargulisbacteria bacterium SCGC AG-410-N11]